MPVYFFIYLTIIVGIFFLLARYFVLRRKSPALFLFISASKAENCGNYHEAIILYEKALSEVQKTRFHQNLKIKIIEKLKVLHTVEIYNNDQAFVRKNNSWINQKVDEVITTPGFPNPSIQPKNEAGNLQ